MELLKLHIGCGTVYLKGFVNCDIQGDHALVRNNLNATTLDRYFKFPFKKAIQSSRSRPIIVDKRFDVLARWPFPTKSAIDIVSISFIEHFTPMEVNFILGEIERVLIPDGAWYVDFPNVKKTVKQYLDKDPEWCMRLLYCHQENAFAAHKWGYTVSSFRRLLQSRRVWKEALKINVVKHDYPMIGMIAVKK